jgi:hypothetical protein
MTQGGGGVGKKSVDPVIGSSGDRKSQKPIAAQAGDAMLFEN